ncbi:MAG: hypothetical protein GX193_08930 [Clostridiales bacterium]|nr:hypothetical protein [Clostridiales bacterium]
MNDVFVEQIIEKRQDLKSTLKKLGIFFAALLISSVFLVIGILRFIFPAVFALCMYGAFRFVKDQNIEFEYSFTNGELDIDRIIGRRKRKSELSVRVRKFEIMAPMVEKYRKEYETQNIVRIVDASSSPVSGSRWFARFNDDSGLTTLLIFEPNERLINAISKYIPGKLKQ